MEKSIEAQIKALTKQAKESGIKTKKSDFTRNLSSLHKIIKTKEQADAFMKLLQSA